MSPERWRQIEQLYHAALEHDPDNRARFLAEVCGSDNELRREVETLLAQEAVSLPELGTDDTAGARYDGRCLPHRSHSRTGRHGCGVSRARHEAEASGSGEVSVRGSWRMPLPGGASSARRRWHPRSTIRTS